MLFSFKEGTMAYIAVTVVDPDGREFSAEIDDQADYSSLLRALVNLLGLPVKKGYGPTDDYVLSIVGAVRLHSGAIVQISEREPPAIVRIRERRLP
jgi:hypothetical protein